jgi:uncharacterized repeat protein (TIGR01451 family)
LPAGLTLVSVTPGQGTYTFTGGTITWNLGSLGSGVSVTTTVLVNVSASASGAISNTATITGNETDPNLSNNTSTTVTQLTTQVDLAITKTVSASRIDAGKQLTYTLTTKNNGPSNATGVKISDLLPLGVTYTSAGGQGTVSAASGVVTVNLGNLAAGVTAVTTLVVNVGATATGTLVNSATVSGDQTETDLTNNKASATTTINVPIIPEGTPDVDLKITKSASPSPVALGSNLTYTLLIQNLPTGSLAHNVVVTDTLPAGVTVLSASPNATWSGNTVRANFSQIALGASITMTIVVRVDSAPSGSLTNVAEVTSSDPEHILWNNKDQITTTVTTPTPLTKRRFLGR